MVPGDPTPDAVRHEALSPELELARVLWRDLVRPLRDFLSNLQDGPRDALTRWSTIEEILALHGLESSSSIRSGQGSLVLAPTGSLADALLRACGEVLGAPAESRDDAFVCWRVRPASRAPFEVSYRVASRGEELAIEWKGQ